MNNEVNLMKKTHCLPEGSMVRVTARYGATIYDEQKNIQKIIETYEKIAVEKILKASNDTYYFQCQTGFISEDDVMLLEQDIIQVKNYFSKLVSGKIKNCHGTIARTSNGKKQGDYPFESTRLFIGNGYSVLGDEFLQTEEKEWINANDVWLENTPWVKEIKKTSVKKLQVISPQGTLVYSEENEIVEELKQGEERFVLAEVEDVLGRHFWQIGPHSFVKKDDCGTDLIQSKTNYAHFWLLPTKNINQNFWGIPNGCEAAALLSGFWYQGLLKNKDYQSWIDAMPISPDYNPYEGFGGSPYEIAKGRFEAIFPPALIKWGSKFGKLRDLTGANEQVLQAALKRGNPVVVYVTIDFGKPEPDTYPWGATLANNHAVLLDGFTDDLWHVNDPISGHYWLTKEKFAQSYTERHWAIEVLKK